MAGHDVITRVHWDCWSECNLACPFCFRSRGKPLDTYQAMEAINRLAAARIAQIAFTGGDPSLRRDLHELVTYAQAAGVAVEVLTNGQLQTTRVLDALLGADLVGLSLDGATAESHDAFRARSGNHGRVLTLIERFENEAMPYIVRTVVSAANVSEVPAIGELLHGRKHLVRWSLQQFSAIETGYMNRAKYQLSKDRFDACVTTVRALHRPHIREISSLSDGDKVGLYLMLNPSGDVFGRVPDPVNGRLPVVGNILEANFLELAARVRFDAQLNEHRYGTWLLGASE